MNKNFAMSYSGGKDSLLALYHLIKLGYTPKVIYTIFNESIKGGNYHSLSIELLNRVSKSIEIPIEYLHKSYSDIYQDVYPEFLSSLKKYDIQYCAFGDIFLEGSKFSNTMFCEKAGLEALFPLWGLDENEVVNSFIRCGFKGLVKAVDVTRVSETILGCPIDQELLNHLRKSDISLCGEYGEYHTFVYDGPIFKYPITFNINGIVENTPYKTLLLQ
ncbi:MAG: ATP-binding protein [Angelakisella sp.]